MIRSTKRDYSLTLSQWMVSLAEGLLIPFVNIYMVHTLGFHPALAGTILGVSGLGLLVSQLPGGALADRFGVKIVIAAGLFLAGIANAVTSLTRNPVLLAISYGTSLLASGGTSPAFYQAATRAAEKRNLQSVGALIAAQNGGVAGGALLALPLLLSTHLHAIFVFAGAVDVIGGFVAVSFLDREPEDKPRVPFRLSDWVYLPPRNQRAFWPIAFAGFLTGVLYSQMWSTVPTVWVHAGVPPMVFALLWFFNGAAIFALERRISRGLEHRNAYWWMAGASAIYAAAMGICAIGVGLITLILSFLILTAGELLYEPFPPAFYAAVAPRGLKARYQGAGNFASATGVVAGPVIGDMLLQWNGTQVLWTVMVLLGSMAAITVLHARTTTRLQHTIGTETIPTSIELRELHE